MDAKRDFIGGKLCEIMRGVYDFGKIGGIA